MRKCGYCLEKIVQGAMLGRRKGRAWKNMARIENIHSVDQIGIGNSSEIDN